MQFAANQFAANCGSFLSGKHFFPVSRLCKTTFSYKFASSKVGWAELS